MHGGMALEPYMEDYLPAPRGALTAVPHRTPSYGAAPDGAKKRARQRHASNLSQTGHAANTGKHYVSLAAPCALFTLFTLFSLFALPPPCKLERMVPRISLSRGSDLNKAPGTVTQVRER